MSGTTTDRKASMTNQPTTDWWDTTRPLPPRLKSARLSPAPYDKTRSRAYNLATPWRWRGLSWTHRDGSYGYAIWWKGSLHFQP
jgi:hypothetical protein